MDFRRILAASLIALGLLATGLPGVGAVKLIGDLTECLGAAKEIKMGSRAYLTHLQDQTGEGDGAAIRKVGNQVDAAFFDYRGTVGGKYVYLLTGRTMQYSCTPLSDLCPSPSSLERALRWSSESLDMVFAGGVPPPPPVCTPPP